MPAWKGRDARPGKMEVIHSVDAIWHKAIYLHAPHEMRTVAEVASPTGFWYGCTARCRVWSETPHLKRSAASAGTTTRSPSYPCTVRRGDIVGSALTDDCVVRRLVEGLVVVEDAAHRLEAVLRAALRPSHPGALH